VSEYTIAEIESRIEEGLGKLLQPLIPAGYRIHVALVDKNGRRKRKNASAGNWSPDRDEVRINFEPAASAKSGNIALGRTSEEEISNSDFKPVDIRGEGLSATVLRERR
jgi:hypothetical protein